MKYRSKWLSEMVTKEELLNHDNTLLIAPCGSGKTYFIFNDVIDVSENVLYLCDTTNLKIATKMAWDKYGDSLTNLTIMSYHQFSKDLQGKSLTTYLNQWDYIIADEFHNLFNFSKMKGGSELEISKLVLTNKQVIPIVCMTATPYEILNNEKTYMTFIENMHVIDFSENKEIKRYINGCKTHISNVLQLQSQLQSYEELWKWTDSKCLIFAEQIQTMRTIENICDNLELSHICIWSENNKDNLLNEEQIRVRNKILEEGLMDDNYQVLIINRSLETGVNIIDKRFKLFVSCSSNITQSIQARNRLRMDLDWIILKTSKKEIPNDLKLTIPKEYCDKPLMSSDVEELITKLNICDGHGELMKSKKLIILLKNNNYIVERKTLRINKKRTRVIVISKKE